MRQWELVITITDKFFDPLTQEEIVELLGFNKPDYISIQINSVTQSK